MMDFKNERHLFNAYKKAAKEFGVEFTDEELNDLRFICKDIYDFVSKEGVSLGENDIKYDVYQMMWSDLTNNKCKENNRILKEIYNLSKNLTEWSNLTGDEDNKKEKLIKKFKKYNKHKMIHKKTVESLESLRTGEILVTDIDETLTAFNRINGECGIYLLYNDKDELMYIGKSKNLSNRILASLRERMCHSFKYAILSEYEYHIVEMYLIMLWRPPLNVEGKSKNKPKIKFEVPIPEFSKLYKVFSINENYDDFIKKYRRLSIENRINSMFTKRKKY